MIKIAIVTDEISADFETAVELGTEWGIHDFELRTFDIHRVPMFTAFQKQRIREVLDEFGARVIAISPGLFKCAYPHSKRERFPLRAFDAALFQQWHDAHDLVRHHLEELLPASIEYAAELGVSRILIFSFQRGSQASKMPPDPILSIFRRAAEQAHRAGLELLIEVEAEFWADTGANTAAIVQVVNHPALGVNWDPGNAYAAGDTPFPEGYTELKAAIRHVHFKDVVRDERGELQYVLNGDINWEGQIQALVTDGYDGYISIETHMQPKVQSARALLERLQSLLNQARFAPD